LDQEALRSLPKEPLRQAIEYVRNRSQALVRCSEDGRVAIDNKAAGRTIRGIDLGPKNWLFCGSDRGGQTAAVHFSLIATCLRHRLDPFAYLRDVYTRLPILLATNPSRDALRPLLSDRWLAKKLTGHTGRLLII
jgi:transposase